jgi:hypothetical protein
VNKIIIIVVVVVVQFIHYMKLTRIHSRYLFHKGLIKASNNGTSYRYQEVLVCALHKGIHSSFPGDKTHLLNVKYQENYKRKHMNTPAALMKTDLHGSCTMCTS